MKMKRINLAEQFPNYFATLELTDADKFAEVNDVQEARLAKLEAKLTPATTETEEQEEGATAAAPVTTAAAAALAAAAPQKSPEVIALEGRLAALEAKFNDSPAALHTAVNSDASAEGASGNKTKQYATSVDAELEKFMGK